MNMAPKKRVDGSDSEVGKLHAPVSQRVEAGLHSIDFSRLQPSFFPKLDLIRDTAKTEYDVLTARGIGFFPSLDDEAEKLLHGMVVEGVVSGKDVKPSVHPIDLSQMNLNKRRDAEQQYEIDRRYAEKCLRAFLTWKVASLIREAAEKRVVEGNETGTNFFDISSQMRSFPELEAWFGQEADRRAFTPPVAALPPHDPIGAHRVFRKINQEKAHLAKLLASVTHEIVSALKRS